MLVVVLLVLTVGDAPGTVRATARSSCSDHRPFSAKATKSRVALRPLKICGFWRPDTIAGGCLPDISRNDASLSAIPASLDALCNKKDMEGKGSSFTGEKWTVQVPTAISDIDRYFFLRLSASSVCSRTKLCSRRGSDFSIGDGARDELERCRTLLADLRDSYLISRYSESSIRADCWASSRLRRLST